MHGTGLHSPEFSLIAPAMTAHKAGDPTTLGRLYGRSKGKKLRAGQQDLLDNLLPQIAVPTEGPVTAELLFGYDRPLHFEIGFGGGEHMAYRADMLPDHGFIGCEPFENGVAQALTHVDNYNGMGPLANVRIHMGDALEVLARIPDGSLSFVYLLHPDPWPKARHAKRRMMNDGPVDMIAAKLKPGGEFRFGTDHAIYLRHALMVMQNIATSLIGYATAQRISLSAPVVGPKRAMRPRPAMCTGTKSGISVIAANSR